MVFCPATDCEVRITRPISVEQMTAANLIFISRPELMLHENNGPTGRHAPIPIRLPKGLYRTHIIPATVAAEPATANILGLMLKSFCVPHGAASQSAAPCYASSFSRAALLPPLSKKSDRYTIKFCWADFPFFVISELYMSGEQFSKSPSRNFLRNCIAF
jgi:hypothetical protein